MSINKWTQHYSNNGLLHYFSAGMQYWLGILGMEQIDYLCKFNDSLLTHANAYCLIWNKSIGKFQMLAKKAQCTHCRKHLHLRLINPAHFLTVLKWGSVQPSLEPNLGFTSCCFSGSFSGSPGVRCAGKRGWHIPPGLPHPPSSLPSTASSLKQTQALLGCWNTHL